MNQFNKLINERHTIESVFRSRIYRFSGLIGTACSSLFLIAALTGTIDIILDLPGALIAYQLIDLLIPVILFDIAARGVTRKSLILVALFTTVSVYIGFRYKIVLLFAPIVCITLLDRRTPSDLRIIRGAVIIIPIILLFGMMTLYRSKFGGLDIEGGAANLSGNWLHGLFAETNILFGMLGVMIEVFQRNESTGIAPITNTFIEYIPRFIYSEKNTTSYLLLPLYNLQSLEALTSGTAYPLSGEFLYMHGILTMVVGAIFIGYIAFLANEADTNLARNPRITICRNTLFGICVGYYFQSRGYLPQLSKTFLFSMLPLMIFLRPRRNHIYPSTN